MWKEREREEGREGEREKERVSNTNYTVDLVYYLGKRGGEKGIRKNIEIFSNCTKNSVFYPIFYYWEGESDWLEGELSFQNLFEYINYSKLIYCKLSYIFT